MFENLEKRFLDPGHILAYANIKPGAQVADFGCGNGFYPVAAAKQVGNSGIVYAIDVKAAALEATVSAAKSHNLKNIYTVRHDMEKTGTPVKDNSCDAVILSGILHLSHLQNNILRESYRVLKTGGSVIVIEWKKQLLPFGPAIERRISEEQTKQIFALSGFKFEKEIPADYFHYSLIFNK